MIKIRIDKYLKNSRIIKRRTIAKEACDQGRVFINDRQAKAGDKVSVGDIINIEFGNRSLKAKVLLLKEHAGRKQASNMYKIIEG